MAERFKAHAWKVCVPSQVPWVRIPLSPPLIHVKKGTDKCYIRYESNKGAKMEILIVVGVAWWVWAHFTN